MVENVFAKISNEKIVEAIVVVIADADALAPAGMEKTSFCSDVGKGAVTVVFEKVIGRLLARGETFQTRAVDQENVDPAVVIVIIKGDATAGGFEKVFVWRSSRTGERC